MRVSILGLGGHHQARPKDEKESIRIVHTAIDNGITFMDNAWDYHDGRAEEVMGKALAMDGYRKKAFLMTKVCDRDHAGAMKHRRQPPATANRRDRPLAVPRMQLLQRSRGPARKGRTEGRARSEEAGYSFESFRHEVVPECAKRGVGVIGMKGCGGDGRILTENVASVEECYRYCLSQPVSVQVVGLATVEHVNKAIEMARAFKPMTPGELKTLASRLKTVAGDGRYEHFKTTQRFDAGYRRAQHGFPV